MSGPLIYVCVAGDELNGKYLAEAKAEDPQRKPKPIVWEQHIDGATLEKARAHAARCERDGYGASRVGRVVFDDESAFAGASHDALHDALRQWRAADVSGDAAELANARAARDAALGFAS